MKKFSKIVFHLIFSMLFLASTGSFCPASSARDTGYQAIPGLMDLRSTFSDGSHSIEDLARIADSRGFKVLFINDHDRISISYGVPPFRNILRYKKELPSIMTNGPRKYLDEIRRVSEKYPGMIIIPGCETSAYYYWTGSWFKKDLMINEYDRRMLITNLTDPGDYNLPVLNNKLSLRYTIKLMPGMIIFILPLLAGIIILVLWRKSHIIAGLLLTVFSVLAIIDYNPFRSSLFSPYNGDQGIAPYQEVIDYINKKGGFSFWNYPEQKSGARKYGPIQTSTPVYPQVLNESKGYTGFAALYGEYTTAARPGHEWDLSLNEYLSGQRKNPPWGISTADFHEDGRLNIKLGAFVTTFLVKESSKDGILEALKNGRFYCSRGDGTDWPVLEYFNITGQDNKKAFMGDTLKIEANPVITFKVVYKNSQSKAVAIDLIRGGKLIKTFTGNTPMEITYTDNDIGSGDRTYYRLMDEGEHLVANPVFVTWDADVKTPR